jgi:hypothetical protein
LKTAQTSWAVQIGYLPDYFAIVIMNPPALSPETVYMPEVIPLCEANESTSLPFSGTLMYVFVLVVSAGT